jgi:hypothetical protein
MHTAVSTLPIGHELGRLNSRLLARPSRRKRPAAARPLIFARRRQVLSSGLLRLDIHRLTRFVASPNFDCQGSLGLLANPTTAVLTTTLRSIERVPRGPPAVGFSPSIDWGHRWSGAFGTPMLIRRWIRQSAGRFEAGQSAGKFFLSWSAVPGRAPRQLTRLIDRPTAAALRHRKPCYLQDHQSPFAYIINERLCAQSILIKPRTTSPRAASWRRHTRIATLKG